MNIKRQISLIQETIDMVADARIYELILRMDRNQFKLVVRHRTTKYPVLEVGLVQQDKLAKHNFSCSITEHTFETQRIESDSGELLNGLKVLSGHVINGMLPDKIVFTHHRDELGNFHKIITCPQRESVLAFYVIKYRLDGTSPLVKWFRNFLLCLRSDTRRRHALFKASQIDFHFSTL